MFPPNLFFIYSALSTIHLVPELNPVLHTPCWTRLSLPSGSSQFGYSTAFRDNSHPRGQFCFCVLPQGLCDWMTVNTLDYKINTRCLLGAEYGAQDTKCRMEDAKKYKDGEWDRILLNDLARRMLITNENMLWILITNGNMVWNLFKTLQFQVSSKAALRIQPMLELIETGARTEAETLVFRRKGYFCVCRSVLVLH